MRPLTAPRPSSAPLRWVSLLLVLGLVACGGGGEAPMTLRFTQALDARVRTIDLRLFAGDQSCDVIRISGPEVRGAYQRTLTVGGDGASASGSFDIVYPDAYTVVAWAYDEAGGPVQFGCSDRPVEIENGVRAEVTLELVDYDGP